MSIVCAVRAPGGGVWVGSDTECTSGNVREYVGPKWVKCGRFWIGWTGGVRGQNLIVANAGSIGRLNSFIEIVDAINGLILGDKWEPRKDPGDPLHWDCAAIITDGSDIASVGGDMSFTIQPKRAAIGSGAEAALGAYAVLAPMDAKNLIGNMLSAAIEISRSCSGEPWYRPIDKPENPDA